MIELRREQVDAILQHARTEAPLEACGLLSGHGPMVLGVHHMHNEDQSEVSYRLAPEEQYRVFLEIEAQGRELIGIYHSHPRSAAYPSARDIEAAYYPEVVYLIVSLAGEPSPALRAFRIRDGAVQEAQLVVLED